MIHFYYKFIATKSPQACNQWSFYCRLKIFGLISVESFTTIWTRLLLVLPSIRTFEYDRTRIRTKNCKIFTKKISNIVYGLFRQGEKFLFNLFTTMFFFKIYQFYLLLECFLRLPSTHFNIILTLLLLDMISKVLAAKCIKVTIGTL